MSSKAILCWITMTNIHVPAVWLNETKRFKFKSKWDVHSLNEPTKGATFIHIHRVIKCTLLCEHVSVIFFMKKMVLGKIALYNCMWTLYNIPVVYCIFFFLSVAAVYTRHKYSRDWISISREWIPLSIATKRMQNLLKMKHVFANVSWYKHSNWCAQEKRSKNQHEQPSMQRDSSPSNCSIFLSLKAQFHSQRRFIRLPASLFFAPAEKELICIFWRLFLRWRHALTLNFKWKCSHLYTLEYSVYFIVRSHTLHSHEHW